jgi:Cdc6-like AAA superfamily ATPase
VIHARSYLSRKEDLEVLDWLTPIDYGLQQTDHLRRRQPGTGQWLLSTQEYCNWVRERGTTLFCPGIPGAGKTILTSVIVDDLEHKFLGTTSVAIIYLFFNFNRKDEQKIEHLLSSLLKQLAQSHPTLPAAVGELYDRHKKKRTKPSSNEISRVLQSVTSEKSRVYIIIDALDECQTSGGCRAELVSEIFNLQSKTDVNILATSRYVPEIETMFREIPRIEIRANDHDIQRYLDSRMSELSSVVAMESDLRETITKGIIKAVDGMYVNANNY